jgi:hypothetical protein
MKRFISHVVVAVMLVGAVAPSALAQKEQAPPPAPAPSPAEPQAEGKTKSAKRAKLRWLVSVMKKEPTVQEVQEAATKYYQLEPERVVTLARNARLKGLVPDINAGMSNRLINEFRNTRDGLYPLLPSPANNPNPNSYKERTQARNDELAWDVQLHWSLDRLVFASESLDAKSLTSLSENLIREVTTLYYSRRRIMISIVLTPPAEPEEFLYELTRFDEITSTLDALTGGMFAPRAWKWSETDLPGWED